MAIPKMDKKSFAKRIWPLGIRTTLNFSLLKYKIDPNKPKNSCKSRLLHRTDEKQGLITSQIFFEKRRGPFQKVEYRGRCQKGKDKAEAFNILKIYLIYEYIFLVLISLNYFCLWILCLSIPDSITNCWFNPQNS